MRFLVEAVDRAGRVVVHTYVEVSGAGPEAAGAVEWAQGQVLREIGFPGTVRVSPAPEGSA